MKRREFLLLAGMSALSGASVFSSCAASIEQSTTSSTSSDNVRRFPLRIAPVTLDLSPKQTIRTVGYNDSAPGPLLRVKEGQRVTVDVRNDSDVPELVHWHGFYVPSDVDGSMEEGTPIVAPGGLAAIFFHGTAERNSLVSHPRVCRQRSAAQSLFGTIWFLLHRTEK